MLAWLIASTVSTVASLAAEGHGGAVKSIAVSPDGTRAVTGSFDYSVMVWNLENRVPLRRLIGHDAGVNSVAIAPDGKHAVSGGDDGLVILWDLAKTEPLHRFTGHKSKIGRASCRERV